MNEQGSRLSGQSDPMRSDPSGAVELSVTPALPRENVEILDFPFRWKDSNLDLGLKLALANMDPGQLHGPLRHGEALHAGQHKGSNAGGCRAETLVRRILFTRRWGFRSHRFLRESVKF